MTFRFPIGILTGVLVAACAAGPAADNLACDPTLDDTCTVPVEGVPAAADGAPAPKKPHKVKPLQTAPAAPSSSSGAGAGASARAPASSTSSATNPSPTAAPCADRATAAECSSCCDTLFPSGSTLWANAIFSCACSDVNCAQACANELCSTGAVAPMGACNACILQPGGCAMIADSTCQNDPTGVCKMWDACYAQAGCAQKGG
jgi:hypothetical protein